MKPSRYPAYERGEVEEFIDYIVPVADLEEIIDDRGHFKRFPSRPKPAYPSKQYIINKLVDLHGSFDVNDGFKAIILTDGEIHYHIAKDWVRKLCVWLSNHDSTVPDLSIDNSDLFTNGQETLVRKNSLTAFSQIVSANTWRELVKWFGGGVSLPVKCIRGTIAPAKILRVVCANDNSHFRRFYFNGYETVENAKEDICEVFGVDPDSARLHDFFRHRPYARIDKEDGMHLRLYKKQLLHNNILYLEVCDERGQFSIVYKPKPVYTGYGDL